MYDVLPWTQPHLPFWQESWNNKNHSSFFCVVSSWGSFLITPQVSKTAQLIQFQSSRLFPQRILKFCILRFSLFLIKFFVFKVVPGRMGLLVTLFLSLTALLVSTITSSPEVTICIVLSILLSSPSMNEVRWPWLFFRFLLVLQLLPFGFLCTSSSSLEPFWFTCSNWPW